MTDPELNELETLANDWLERSNELHDRALQTGVSSEDRIRCYAKIALYQAVSAQLQRIVDRGRTAP